MHLALVVLIALACDAAIAANDDLGDAQVASLPDWVIDVLNTQPMAIRYRVCTCLNPFYQRGDFDGDGKSDYAVTIRSIASNKSGVVVIHRRDGSTHVLGAGVDFGNGGDDFSRIDAWQIVDRGPLDPGENEKPPLLRGDALRLGKTESASGLAWWDGKTYRWHQQGD
jgi:hypothetical protein